MQLFVKTLSNQTLSVNADSLFELKKQVYEHEAIPVDKQRFVYGKNTLEDFSSLRSDSTVRLVLPIVGGSSKKKMFSELQAVAKALHEEARPKIVKKLKLVEYSKRMLEYGKLSEHLQSYAKLHSSAVEEKTKLEKQNKQKKVKKFNERHEKLEEECVRYRKELMTKTKTLKKDKEGAKTVRPLEALTATKNKVPTTATSPFKKQANIIVDNVLADPKFQTKVTKVAKTGGIGGYDGFLLELGFGKLNDDGKVDIKKDGKLLLAFLHGCRAIQEETKPKEAQVLLKKYLHTLLQFGHQFALDTDTLEEQVQKMAKATEDFPKIKAIVEKEPLM